MIHLLDLLNRRTACIALGLALCGCLNQVANATATMQRVWLLEVVKPMDNKEYYTFVRKEAKCNVCHQGKGGHANNPYGAEMAKLVTEEDEKDKEKVIAAIKHVNDLPYDPTDENSETFGERIAAGKLPGGDDLEALKQAEVEAEPLVLFDGKTLDGWTGDTGSYEVREDFIASIKGKGGNLYTRQQFDNFELTFEFRLTPGANNGIGIRTPVQGDAAYVGIELQVLDNSAEKWANLKPYQYHGSAYGIAPAKRGALKPVGEWNTQTIRAEDRKITVTLNEEVILDIDLDEAAPEGKTIDGRPHPGLERSTGHIGFLGHGDEVHFRNLKIMVLKDEKE